MHAPYGFATDGGSETDDSDDAGAATPPRSGSEPAATASPIESLTDPDTLRKCDAVERRERTITRGEADHCERGAAGRAVVGVTNDDGEVLVLVHDESGHPVLPNEVVDPGGDWAVAGRRAVEEATELTVDLDGAVRRREMTHEYEGDEPSEQTTHVVFRASPASDAQRTDSVSATADGWTAGWYDDLPGSVDGDGQSEFADVRLFLD